MSTLEPWRDAVARADALLTEGEAADDVGVIATAVSAFHAALKLAPRPSAPRDWAWTQCRLSAALRALAVRSGDPMLPDAAVAAAAAALQEYSYAASPLDWARAHALLGTAQTVAGERAGDPE